MDLNPSSVEAHECLGLALSCEIMAGNVRPANDSDAAERAESHLKQASDFSPSAAGPRVSELNGESTRALLLISKLLEERALLRDTADQYSGDMQAAHQWRLQFPSAGGHPQDSRAAQQYAQLLLPVANSVAD